MKGEVWEKGVPKEGWSRSVISAALLQRFYCIIAACLSTFQLLLLLSVTSSDVDYRGVSVLVPAILGWIIVSVVFIFSRPQVKVVEKFFSGHVMTADNLKIVNQLSLIHISEPTRPP